MSDIAEILGIAVAGVAEVSSVPTANIAELELNAGTGITLAGVQLDNGGASLLDIDLDEDDNGTENLDVNGDILADSIILNDGVSILDQYSGRMTITDTALYSSEYFRFSNSVFVTGAVEATGNFSVGGNIEADGHLRADLNVEADTAKVNVVRISDWTIEAPDYVFADDYELRDLSAVEDYVKENKHLPEVPSAEEMKENGVNLSELNMTLLKKVEELTLYVIAQNKEIEILKNAMISETNLR